MAQNEVVAYIQDRRRAGVSYDEIDEALCQKSVLLAAVAEGYREGARRDLAEAHEPRRYARNR
jgi:hypothetical protein